MGELTEIINRRRDAIQGWIHKGTLPKHLMPQRGWHNYYFWTPAQVNEISKWCKSPDKFPLLLTEDDVDRSVVISHQNYRVPRKVIAKIRKLVARNYSREQINEALFIEVRYITTDAFDRAIVNVCRYNGFPVPPRYLTGSDVRFARTLHSHGKCLEAVVNALYKRTSYTDHIELEGDLVRALDLRDWELPKSDPSVKWEGKLTHQQQAEIRALERQLKAIERLLK